MQMISAYFAKHWRGGFSLAFSFWVDCFLIAWIGGSIPLGFCNVATHHNGVAAALVVLAAGGTTVALWVWGIIGTWAACRNSYSVIGTLVARILLVLYSLVTGLIAVSVILVVGWMIVTGKSVPRNGTSVHGDGTALEFSGIINQYMIGDFTAKLSSTPGLQRVDLNSQGGDQPTATTMATLIASHGLDTVVTRQCKGYCVVAFMAGRKRSLSGAGRLIFIGDPAASTPPAHGFMPQVPDTAALTAAGIPADFVAQIALHSHGMGWAPGVPELKAAGILTTP